MEYVETKSELERFISNHKALLLLAPNWSRYPREIQKSLEEAETDLNKENISVFACRSDQGPITSWLADHIHPRHWAAGSGTIFAFSKGVVLEYIPAPCSLKEDGKLLPWIKHIFEKIDS